MTERIDESYAKAYGDSTADYDVIRQSFDTEIAGDRVAYNQLIGLCQAAAANPGDNAEWAAVEAMLDCENYADYLMLYFYTYAGDWPINNWRAVRRRAANSKFKFIIWDSERAFWPSFANADRTTLSSGAAQIHGILLGHSEYQKVWQNRSTIHFGSGGVFALDNGNHAASASFQLAMNDYKQTIFTKSARWGDNQKTPAYGLSDWESSANNHRDNLIPQRRSIFLNHLKARNLAPQNVN